MLIHYSDKITGFYTQSVDIETPEGWKPPSYATFTKPNDSVSGKLNQLQSNGSWLLVDDPEYYTVYSIADQSEKLVTGKTPEGYTKVKPDSKNHKFHKGKWMLQNEILGMERKQKIAEINSEARKLIESGFSYDGYEFDTTFEDQFNIQSLHSEGGDQEVRCIGSDGIKKHRLFTNEFIGLLISAFAARKKEILKIASDLKVDVHLETNVNLIEGMKFVI